MLDSDDGPRTPVTNPSRGDSLCRPFNLLRDVQILVIRETLTIDFENLALDFPRAVAIEHEPRKRSRDTEVSRYGIKVYDFFGRRRPVCGASTLRLAQTQIRQHVDDPRQLLCILVRITDDKGPVGLIANHEPSQALTK